MDRVPPACGKARGGARGKENTGPLCPGLGLGLRKVQRVSNVKWTQKRLPVLLKSYTTAAGIWTRACSPPPASAL